MPGHHDSTRSLEDSKPRSLDLVERKGWPFFPAKPGKKEEAFASVLGFLVPIPEGENHLRLASCLSLHTLVCMNTQCVSTTTLSHNLSQSTCFSLASCFVYLAQRRLLLPRHLYSPSVKSVTIYLLYIKKVIRQAPVTFIGTPASKKASRYIFIYIRRADIEKRRAVIRL